MRKILPVVLAAGVAAAAIHAVGSEVETAQAPSGDNAPAPMPVSVAPAMVRDLAETAEFPGFLEATKTVELRPRVGGMVEGVEMPEGAMVKRGQLLFRLDRRPYVIALMQAEAALAEAQARHALASRQHARAAALAEGGHTSKDRLDQQVAELAALDAQVQSAQAAVDAAKLDLDFTAITAPMDGRIGRALVTEGNLVTPGETALARIVSVDPIHVVFDVDEPTYLRLLAEAGSISLQREVDVTLSGETGFTHRGRLEFLDNEADRSTGTARLRAVIPNPDGALAPGVFARVRLPLSAPAPKILVPEAAIGSAQGGRYVLIASPDGTADYRPVKIGPATDDGFREVHEGLAPGENVIVRGMVRPGTAISPVPVSETSSSEEAAS